MLATVAVARHSELETGTAGASAMREYERRRRSREHRVREKHPRIGGLILALSEPPSHETAWARGAAGEQRVAAELAKYVRDDVVVLHDRAIRHSQSNIDHIAIAPSGVWVIDAKRYKGKVAVRKPLFGVASLTIAGRKQTKLIHALSDQVALVDRVLGDVVSGVAVHGALCFIDSELPLLGTLSLDGFAITAPKPLAKRINAKGSLPRDDVRRLATQLADIFPPA